MNHTSKKFKLDDNEKQLIQIFSKSIIFLIWQSFCKFRFKLRLLKKTFQKNTKKGALSKRSVTTNIRFSKTFSLWKIIYFYQLFFKKNFLEPIFFKLKKHIPQKHKNSLKFILKYVNIKNRPSQQILNEWNTFALKRSGEVVDIIEFGVISYKYRHQRPQQLASALHNLNYRIFYIENEFNYSPSSALANFQVTRIEDGIYSIKLSAPSNYFIYSDHMSQYGKKLIFSALKKLMREAKIINPVAKIDHPFWGEIANKLQMPIIYDAMDLHSGFKESNSLMERDEKALIKKSNLLITSSDYLNNRLKNYSNNSLLLKNACDFGHFDIHNKFLPVPTDIKGASGNIIGYYGAIADWLDEAVIEKVAQNFPTDTLVLIGKNQNEHVNDLAKKYRNILLLGEKSYKELPNYLNRFDVCLIPFKLTELIKATNPVKIYEYFAAGKPVIATEIPELKEYKNLLYIAKDAKSFVSAVSQAITEKSPETIEKRIQIAKENTWTGRAKILDSAIRSSFFPKISVIILVFNNARLSKISIDSVLKRSLYPNLELIIVDNNSDQETVKMLQNYKSISNVKTIFNKVNYGFAKGNNIGMKIATGDYIVLLNNDVRVTPGWIERLAFYAKNKRIGLVGPVTNSIGNESKIDIVYDPENSFEVEEKAANYTYSHWGESIKLRNIAAFCWLKRRDIYQKIGNLDERFGKGLFEDDDYCLRVTKARLDILCVEDSFVHHYGGASTNWGSPEYQALFNTNKEKFESKWRVKWTPHEYRK